jgi:hypothetical protein
MSSLRRFLLAAVAALGCARSAAPALDSSAAGAHDPSLHAEHTAGADSGFAALQSRGAIGMGVDQYTSTHTFEPRPDGGRITLRRDVDDSAGVTQIRSHLATIAAAFAAGDFGTPAFVHAGPVPGTDVMKEKRSSIRYSVGPVPRGGELVITTTDSVAVAAIHAFLGFQRKEHRTP